MYDLARLKRERIEAMDNRPSLGTFVSMLWLVKDASESRKGWEPIFAREKGSSSWKSIISWPSKWTGACRGMLVTEAGDRVPSRAGISRGRFSSSEGKLKADSGVAGAVGLMVDGVLVWDRKRRREKLANDGERRLLKDVGEKGEESAEGVGEGSAPSWVTGGDLDGDCTTCKRRREATVGAGEGSSVWFS